MNGVVDPVRRGFLARFVLLLALLLASGVLPAAPALAEGRASAVLTGCVAPQRSGDTPAALLAAPDRFDCTRPQSAWGPGNYWVRLDLPAGAAMNLGRVGGTPHLRFMPQWQHTLAIYSRDSEGGLIGQFFDNADLSRLVGIGGAAGVALDGHAHPVTQVLVRIDGALNATGLLLSPRLLSEDQLHADELTATAIFAAFAGLGLGLFCYNLVLWLTIRERFQLTYCLSLLAMLAYVWSSSGAMTVQFPTVPQDLRFMTSYVMLAFVGALAFQFITDILEPRTVPRRIRRLARHYGAVFVVAALAICVVPPEWRHLADRVFVASFVPLPVLVVAISWTAWRRGSRSVRVLAIAWAVPLAMCVVRICHALNLLPGGLLAQYSLVIGMGIEALLSSLAMSFRIKLIAAERDRALADERAARHLASVDSLTGLLNRRALLEQVIAWSSPEPLRLLIVDIDHFKQINDTHGHLVGDEVLRALAEVLAIRSDLRASVARLGGEEFALVGTAEELSEGIALGILADIRSRPLYRDVRVTVSIGMADGPVHGDDEWRDLYHRADEALYQAKAQGRNRAVHAPPPTTRDGASLLPRAVA
jgi:diguanylate cyclase (GGDEF)-like protein